VRAFRDIEQEVFGLGDDKFIDLLGSFVIIMLSSFSRLWWRRIVAKLCGEIIREAPERSG
jgi:hypothetical protein